ncbi:MAG TPA: TonB-dependent receptor plug domain-containing protein [Polyangiaceae bacterium]|nr:TonB-dependent receptor plug domain-containing protein [Polyangiaceae bacterium]
MRSFAALRARALLLVTLCPALARAQAAPPSRPPAAPSAAPASPGAPMSPASPGAPTSPASPGAPTSPAAPPSAAVAPPTLLGSSEVGYPAGATGEARVLLELLVSAEGAVVEARAVEGPEPFVAAALAAARGWRFSPATRGGATVRARVRFLVAFRPPADEAPAAPAAPAGGPAAPAAAGGPPRAPPDAPTEVTVQGQRPAPGVSSLTRAEVRQLPGAFGDPFRAIEALPGVTPIVSGVPYFYVRGAPPGNIGYFLDGVRVPYLYHVGLGPSVVHPGIVDRVDLYPGGYPARYGRFAGGIVAGETTPPRPEWHGEGNLRLLDAGALVEAPFDGGRGTALVGGRYSYTALAVSLLAPEVKLDYRDYQARVSYDLGPRDTVSLFSFGAYDLVGERENGRLNILFGAEFYRLDLRYDHRFAEGGSLRAGFTLGFEQTHLPDGRNARDRMLAGRLEYARAFGPGLLVRAGADVAVDNYDVDLVGYGDPYDQDARELNETLSARTDVAFGARADVVWRPAPGVEVVPGLRADVFRSDGASAAALDPRLAATLAVSRRARVVHALGLAHQAPSFVAPVPGLSVSGLRGGLQRSAQASAGVELDLPADVTASAAVFKSVFFNMSDALGARAPDEGPVFDARSLGSSQGFELFVRRRLTSRVGGFVTYTLSRSLRAAGRQKFPSAFDRAHVLNLALACDLGRRWRAGGRFVFYSGFPRFDQGDDDDDDDDSPLETPDDRALHPPRQPPFYRLDVRLEKRWQVTRTVWWSLVFEVLNATLSREIIEEEPIGPVTIPSIGVEAGF